MKKILVEDCERLCIWEFIRDVRICPETLFSYGRYRFPAGNSSQIIEFASSRTNFGGKRIWFVCPFCNKRKGVLYRPDDLSTYGCVSCHDLAYSCQNRHRELKYEVRDKYHIQKEKILKKLRNKCRRSPIKTKLLDTLINLEAKKF